VPWELAAILFAAFLVEASLGFGATLIAVALGALLLPLEVLLPVLVCLNLPLSLFVLVRDRRHVDRRLLGKLLLWMGLGLPLGLAVFLLSAPSLLKVFLGVGIATGAAAELLRRSDTPQAPLGNAVKNSLLLLGGVVHGLYAIGGPLAVYVAGRQLGEKAAFRGTLSVLWLLLNVALLAGYVLSGAATLTTLELALPLLLPLVAGALLGDWLHRRATLAVFRRLVFALLLGAGVALAAGA